MHGQKGSGLYGGQSAAVPAAPQPPVRKTNAENSLPGVQRTTPQQKLKKRKLSEAGEIWSMRRQNLRTEGGRARTREQELPQCGSKVLGYSATRAECSARDRAGPKVQSNAEESARLKVGQVARGKPHTCTG